MNRIDPNITFLYNLRALLKLSKLHVRLSIVVPDPDTTTCSDGRDPRCSGSGNRCQINGISPFEIGHKSAT